MNEEIRKTGRPRPPMVPPVASPIEKPPYQSTPLGKEGKAEEDKTNPHPACLILEQVNLRTYGNTEFGHNQ